VTLVRSCTTRAKREPDLALPHKETAIPPTGAVFVSDAMSAIVANVAKIASTKLPILVTGETGTGKEVLARLIHQESCFAPMPFVAFNCATVPKELLDSQLFGHRRGAFTGAHQDFQGIIRAAEGGTLFLDEIGDLTRESQPKLLRFLESGEIHPLGALRPGTANVRIIAATNAELDALVLNGLFRQDLLYRLNAVRYRLPPLRERREEIPALVEHFLALYSAEFRKARVRIADETLDYLLFYSWPGNVRQLANEIRRAVAVADPGDVLSPAHLSTDIAPGWQARETSTTRPSSAGLLVTLDQPLASATAALERAMVDHALEATNGKVDAAARRLGVSRKGLYLKRQRIAAGAKNPPKHA
jgi:DNA-binding NtrC family response regulator